MGRGVSAVTLKTTIQQLHKPRIPKSLNIFLKVQRDILAVIGPDIKAEKEVQEIVPVAKDFIKLSLIKMTFYPRTLTN